MEKSFVAIGVKSTSNSISFYKNVLNFKIDKRFSPAYNIEIVWLKNDNDFIIELVKRDDMPLPDNSKSSVTLCFTVNNIQKYKKILEENTIDYTDFSPPGGPKMLRFYDPDNVGISFISNN